SISTPDRAGVLPQLGTAAQPLAGEALRLAPDRKPSSTDPNFQPLRTPLNHLALAYAPDVGLERSAVIFEREVALVIDIASNVAQFLMVNLHCPTSFV